MEISDTSNNISGVYKLLGGSKTINGEPNNFIETHRLLEKGLPAETVTFLIAASKLVDNKKQLPGVLGMSVRTIQRKTKARSKGKLSLDQSNRIWKYAETLNQAIDVFGSQENAENWFNVPAIGLNQNKPIDLLKTAVGVELVQNYLSRMEYGVYT